MVVTVQQLEMRDGNGTRNHRIFEPACNGARENSKRFEEETDASGETG
ncbi:MAG: hypothetical protein LBF88_10125 [Planctomycetaceae bacterium]|nr:hypothetical protein [Planctomycetaceae bacterium]